MAISCCRKVLSSSIDDLRSGYFWLGLIAEGLGTLVLVLIGCGTCLGGTATDGSTTSWENFEPTKVQISLAFGLAVATIVWNIAHVSGGHINPAVTVAMLFTRKISAVRAVLYVFAQCVGAVAGAAILAGLTPSALHGQLGLTTVNPDLTKEQGFGVELVITFVLVLTVFACCDSNRNDLNGSAPLTIGFSVTLCHLFAIKYTGSSMNPARSFGPAVIMNTWTDHWVYWAGPIIGGMLAGLWYELVFASDASFKKAKHYLFSADHYPPVAPASLIPFDKLDVEMQLQAAIEEKRCLRVTEAEASL